MRCPISMRAFTNSCSATNKGTCQQQHWLKSSSCFCCRRTSSASLDVVFDDSISMSFEDDAFCIRAVVAVAVLFVFRESSRRTPPDSRCCGHFPNARPILKFSWPMLSVDWLCVTPETSWRNEARSVMVPMTASDLERLCDFFLVGVAWCVISWGLCEIKKKDTNLQMCQYYKKPLCVNIFHSLKSFVSVYRFADLTFATFQREYCVCTNKSPSYSVQRGWLNLIYVIYLSHRERVECVEIHF